ncbi:hypothetical protein C0992_012785, partial [Termitomyces sp. T32_za158]
FYSTSYHSKRKHTSGWPVSVHTQLNALSKAYGELEKENLELHSENSTLRAHCAFAGTEIHNLKQRLSAKENRPRKRRKLNVDARWLNSNKGLKLAEAQEAARLVEEQRKREAREQQAAKEAEREQQR